MPVWKLSIFALGLCGWARSADTLVTPNAAAMIATDATIGPYTIVASGTLATDTMVASDTIVASGTLATDTMVAPDTIAARARGCSTCHGARGEGTADLNFPRIAGKPAGYLTHQLLNFRDGQRSYPPMNYLLAYLHDDYLEELAAYFAAQPAPKQKPVEPQAAVNPAGGTLVSHGDPAAGIPACTRCHGARLTGLEPGIPGLLGLSSRYIAAQLVSWRVGTRHANAPDCMSLIASRLSETQIRQVSVWLAAQLPDPTPAPQAGSWKTPIACGSEP